MLDDGDWTMIRCDGSRFKRWLQGRHKSPSYLLTMSLFFVFLVLVPF